MKLDEIDRVLRELGVTLLNPFLTLTTLTGAAIPYLKIEGHFPY